MKIRGNTISTHIKPEKNILKATDFTEAERKRVRDNIGAISLDDLPVYDGSYSAAGEVYDGSRTKGAV